MSFSSACVFTGFFLTDVLGVLVVTVGATGAFSTLMNKCQYLAGIFLCPYLQCAKQRSYNPWNLSNCDADTPDAFSVASICSGVGAFKNLKLFSIDISFHVKHKISKK